MSIDDAVASLQSLNASDERQAPSRLTVILARQAVRLVKLFPGMGLPAVALESTIDAIHSRTEGNQTELVNVIAAELAKHI